MCPLKTNLVAYPFLILLVPARLFRDISTFDVHHPTKVNPSDKCVFTANVVCGYTRGAESSQNSDIIFSKLPLNRKHGYPNRTKLWELRDPSSYLYF
jgi:hypothetical protein